MNDDRIVNYMKVRHDHARTVACVIAVQLFVLAVYFCLYALIAGNVFLSLSEGEGKVILISLAIALALGLCYINCMAVIHAKKVNITRPDSMAIRDGKEVVRIAYSTARPVLIYKITYGLILMTFGGIVYIMLLSLMEDQILAGLYGRIICCIASAAAVLIAYPCIDRIACYRALLSETHELFFEEEDGAVRRFTAAFSVPLAICVWYIMRYFSTKQNIAWIVFPVTALFALAIVFLINIKKVDKSAAL